MKTVKSDADPLPFMNQVPSDEHNKPAEAAFATRPAAPISPGTIEQPHLSAAESRLFQRVLSSSARNYLEFGIGGSTIAAVRSGAAEIVSVDSDGAWVAAVSAHPEVRPVVDRGHASLIHADIGPVGEWGRPYDFSSAPLWPRYIAMPWAEWSRRGSFPDLVYVDGRFRVACVLSVALASLARSSAAGPHILMHDMSPQRPGYAQVYLVCEDIEAADTLRLLRLKPEVDRAEVLSRFLSALFNPE